MPLPSSYGLQWPNWYPWPAYHRPFTRAPTLTYQDNRQTQASPLQQQEETYEEQEIRANQEAMPQTTISSSLPNKALMSSPPSLVDDFLLFRTSLNRWPTLQIPLEEVTESQRKLLDILHSVTPSRVALPINESLPKPSGKP